MAFTHLHTHTQFSLLDGFCRLDPLMERVAELGMKHIALTDHGNMFGAIQFYKAAKKYGLKPILGCEVYVCADRFDRSDRHRNHLVLLAENEQGYRNLMKIVSEAYVHGFYYKPRIDKLFLSEHHEGLIALSACLAGEVARAAVELHLRVLAASIVGNAEFGEGARHDLRQPEGADMAARADGEVRLLLDEGLEPAAELDRVDARAC